MTLARENKIKKEGKKKKGGVLSLLAAILLFLAAAAFAAWNFHPVAQLESVREAVITYTGFFNETFSPALLSFVLSLIILTSRKKRPFNYIFLPLAVAIYYTLLAAVHVFTGNAEPEFLMSRISQEKNSLVVVLIIMEVLICLILAIINSSLNAVYRRRREKREILLAAKAQAEVTVSEENTEVNLSPKEEKKRKKEETKKAKEETAAAKAGAKKTRKGKKDSDSTASGASPAGGDDGEVSVKVDAAGRSGSTPDPDSPLSFPSTARIPDFSTIPKGEIVDLTSSGRKEEKASVREKKAEKDFSIPQGNVVSMSVLENSARNVEKMIAQEKEKNEPVKKGLFKKGGMLESALEASQAQHVTPGPNPNPIIGYDDRRGKKDERKNESSFAPSNLSPDHPRYKLFESLKRKNTADSAPSDSAPDVQSPDVSHFPSRTYHAENTAPVHSRAADAEISLKEDADASSAPAIQKAAETVKPAEPVKKEKPVSPAAEEVKAEPVHPVSAPAMKSSPAVKSAEVVHEPAAEPVHHAKSAVKEVFVGEEESIMDEDEGGNGKDSSDSQIEFKVGISGLTSNNAGEKAIIQRQRKRYTPPSPDLLKDFPQTTYEVGENEEYTGRMIESVMHDFKVDVQLADIVKGPTITLYEYTLAPGVLVSKVLNLEKNIGLRIGGQKIRILAPVPGKSAVGIEVPNAKRATVGFKELLPPLKKANLNVPMILGRDIQGEPKVLDVSKCPHLLIAGTTGSGKSVCINGLIASILYTKSPKDVRLIMVDPKVVELNVYNGIPHLLTPVITEPKRVLKMLNWLVEEMDRRYNVFSQAGVRNIENFNARIHEFGYATEKMPYIVLIMDEFADLMTVIGKDIEDYIRRIMAKARAAGIHVVMATQRPSSEVVTGTIKNNIPTRIAFAASSGMNSRIVLDEMGAENLLGKGDMLLSTQSSPGLVRIQGAFLSEDEVDQIVRHVKSQGEPDYLDEAIFEDDPEPDDSPISEESLEGSDADLYEKAKQICFERKGASASYLQRRLSIGYNRAARLVEQMEDEGIVGPANGSKPREILRYE